METTSIIFQDSFRNHAEGDFPDGWRVELHSAHHHRLGYVTDRAYGIHANGNRHILIAPPVADFDLAVRCHGDSFVTDTATLLIYFRYNRSAREGYYVSVKWGAAGALTEFGACRGQIHSPASTVSGTIQHTNIDTPVMIELSVRDNVFVVRLDGEAAGSWTDPDKTFNAPGAIGFDRPRYRGSLSIDDVTLSTTEKQTELPLGPPLDIAIPRGSHGMEIPYSFRIEGIRRSGQAVLRVRLTGGLKKKTRHPDPGYLYANELLTKPYIRLCSRSAGLNLKHYVVNGTVGWTRPQEDSNFMFCPADYEVPVDATVVLNDYPQDTVISVGYERYEYEVVHDRAGGPAEFMFDTQRGRLLPMLTDLYAPTSLDLSVESPADKEIVSRIPNDLPDREQALTSARSNHYFVEGEPYRLAVLVRAQGAAFQPDECEITAVLEDAFLSPMSDPQRVTLEDAGDEASRRMADLADIRSLRGAVPGLDGFGPGVYHIQIVARVGGHVWKTLRRAFEIMPRDPRALPAPLISGLPELVCFHMEIKENETGPFDPWQEEAGDAGHYYSVQCTRLDMARRRQPWKLFRLYGRKLMICAFPRAGNASTVEENRELVNVADYLYASVPRETTWRYYLWFATQYKGECRAILLDFLRSQKFTPIAGGCLTADAVAALPPDKPLPFAMFEELVKAHWKPWLLFFADWHMDECMPRRSAEIRANNPSLRLISYGTSPVYVDHYKSAYFSLYSGYDLRRPLEQRFQQVLLQEDYPDAIAYDIQRGIYVLATMKVLDPGLRVFPEFYSEGGWAGDPGVYYGNPPTGRLNSSPGLWRKRLFEYAYAAVWFADKGFEYWTDNGIHVPLADMKRLHTLLRTWGTIRRIRPTRPLRTAAFVFSMDACLKHPDYLATAPAGPAHSTESLEGEDVFNTAEECTAFAYEQARADGQLAGFVVRMDCLRQLNPADVTVLVLPPLVGMDTETLDAIRSLHHRGVNLVGFEDVSGLEDLFGVRTGCEPVRVRRLRALADDPAHPLRELARVEEGTDHPLCVVRHETAGAEIWIEGRSDERSAAVPVLTFHRTASGTTAFYTLPPTTVARADLRNHPAFGRESLSLLMNRSLSLVLRHLGPAPVVTSEGKAIAFYDSQHTVHILILEDRFPHPALAIDPLVTIRLPGMGSDSIRCECPFAVVSNRPGDVSIRLHLEPEQTCWIEVG
jgi:hypothetical protein